MICFLFFVVLFARDAEAKTLYVRPDGGSIFQCDGQTDAPYPGSGRMQPCAYRHPAWALAVEGAYSVFQGGDTLIIHPGRYRTGWKAPNQNGVPACSSDFPWDCYMRPVPSGPDPENPTRILGLGWDQGCPDQPVLFGVERVNRVLNLEGSSNVDIQCLRVTDANPCTAGITPETCRRDSFPFGAHADVGIFATDSQNVRLRNVNIEGLTYYGIHAARLRDWTLESVQILGNSMGGWNGDLGADSSSNSGTILFDDVTIQWNGCGWTEDRKPHTCFGQDHAGYGDGLGTHKTGGDWIFRNSDISYNTSDGVDLLYHVGTGRIRVERTLFRGNAGNQLKVGATTEISNSILIGDCAFFDGKSYNFGVTHCRAWGNTFSGSFHKGMYVTLVNSTVTGEGDVLVVTSGNGCNGREKVVARNNIFVGYPEFNTKRQDRPALYYASGRDGNGTGPCGQVSFDNDNALVWGVKHQAEICSRGDLICEEPAFQGGESRDAADVRLGPGSPAINRAVAFKDLDPRDYQGRQRGENWDLGALEYRTQEIETREKNP